MRTDCESFYYEVRVTPILAQGETWGWLDPDTMETVSKPMLEVQRTVQVYLLACRTTKQKCPQLSRPHSPASATGTMQQAHSRSRSLFLPGFFAPPTAWDQMGTAAGWLGCCEDAHTSSASSPVVPCCSQRKGLLATFPELALILPFAPDCADIVLRFCRVAFSLEIKKRIDCVLCSRS
jgi:hypothetical protein